jgi:CDP-diglyceride synthetase
MADSVDYNAATDGFRIVFSTGYRVGYFFVNILLMIVALLALMSVFGAARVGGLFGAYWLRLPIALGLAAWTFRRILVVGLTASPVTISRSDEVRRGPQRVHLK